MSRKNRSPEEQARRAKIRELLQESNIGGAGNEGGNIYRHRIQLPQEENQARGISGNHGRDHSLGRVGRRDRTLLPQGEARPSSHGH